MTPSDARLADKAGHLRREINRHDHLYHTLGEPYLSDAEYRQLRRELHDLEGAHPDLVTADSPTHRTGHMPLQAFTHVNHARPMLNLATALSMEEFSNWLRKTQAQADDENLRLICELKIDGPTLSLSYSNGVLTRAITKGDGSTGEDVTDNARTIRNIPLRLQGAAPGDLEVRGQVHVPLAEFHRLNEERARKGEPPHTNPRNSAAGALKNLDSRLTADRGLSFWAHSGHTEATAPWKTEWDSLKWLESAGLPVEPHRQLCETLEEITKYRRDMEEHRDMLGFEIDGIVVKVNQQETQASLGNRGQSPNWAVAWKFHGKQATTLLQTITLSVGKAGLVTPIAELTPVSLGGVTIKQASLHSAADIAKRDIRAGDIVRIERAGDVIPRVLGPVKSRRSGREQRFTMPSNCPECGTPLEKPQGDTHHRCPNMGCPPQFAKLLKHFTSPKGIDAEHFGLGRCEEFTRQGLVKDLADIYTLSRTELMQTTHTREGMADKLMESIRESKKRPMANLLAGLGIPHVGGDTATMLADIFHSMGALAEASERRLRTIPGIGPATAKSVTTWFADDGNRDTLQRMRDAGVNMLQSTVPDGGETHGPRQDQRQETGNARFLNRTFVITGTLPGMSRVSANELIRALGGRTTTTVSKLTDCIIAGDAAGSSMDKALNLGIEVMEATEFAEHVEAWRASQGTGSNQTRT